MNGMLSQEELNTLLKENNENNEELISGDSPNFNLLSPVETDVLGEIANIAMGSAATTLSGLLGKKIEITTPKLTVSTLESIKEKYADSYFIFKVKYKAGLEGTNMFILQTHDVRIIADLLMGGDGDNSSEELSDIQSSAVCEAMNQMMSASATSVSQIVNRRIEVYSPIFKVATFDDDSLFEPTTEEILAVFFRLNIEGLVDSEMIQFLPVSSAKSIANEIINANIISAETEKKTHIAVPETAVNNLSFLAKEASVMGNIEISPAKFVAFKGESNPRTELPNLDLIMDIGLQLSVELGRTHKKIKDILELTNGSIIELDKLAGEPVDILVNGKLLAHGEVVVIDENFGVRVTGIISPEDRLRSLK